MTDHPAQQSRPPAVEIFVDGSNSNLARIHDGISFRVDLNLLATRLSRGYHFVKLHYYTSPLPDVRSPAYRGQQKFFEELRRSRRLELVLGRHERASTSPCSWPGTRTTCALSVPCRRAASAWCGASCAAL